MYFSWISVFRGFLFYFSVITVISAQRCPHRWADRPGGPTCYRFWPASLKTWAEARAACTQRQGDLLKLESQEETNWVLSKLSQYPASNEWWIGLNNRDDVNTWVWADDTPRNDSFIRWGSGEPNNYLGEERCSEIWDSLLNDKNCRHPLQYICERPKATPLLCDVDDGWSHLDPDVCYKLYGTTATYDDAKLQCESADATMITIQDEARQRHITDVTKDADVNATWIGLRHVTGGRASWVWPDMSKLTTSAWWDGGLPDDQSGSSSSNCLRPPCHPTKGSLDCAILNSTVPGLGNWQPSTCEGPRAFICTKPQGTCPEGWLQHQSRCFRFHTGQGYTWDEARGFCNLRRAALLELSRSSDNLFLAASARSIMPGSTESIWLGLSVEGGTLVWASGSDDDVPTSMFTANSNATTSGCAYTSTESGQWGIGDCGIPRGVVCTVPVNTPIRSLPDIKPRYECVFGWHLHHQSCYRVRREITDWVAARGQCVRDGGDLLTVADQETQDFIIGLISDEVWIGLNDRRVESTFVWLDNTEQILYTNWRSGEPNGVTIGGVYGENCGAMGYARGQPSHGQWLDYPCSFKLSYVCKRQAEFNIAPGKFATASSTGQFGPEKALEGCSSRTGPTHLCCSDTGRDNPAWWQLDLGIPYNVGKVVVHAGFESNCADCRARLHNFRLFVSNDSGSTSADDLIFQDKRPLPPALIILPLKRSRSGRFIRIDIPDRAEILSLCDIQVYRAEEVMTPDLTEANSNCYTDSTKWAGHVSHGLSGRLCQTWMDNFPHDHSFHGDERFADGDEAAALNNCRDPDQEGQPWCYTMDPAVRWEYCGIPQCTTQIEPDISNSTGTPAIAGDDINGCGPGWRESPSAGLCYSISASPLSWADAVTSCENTASTLVVVETEEEQTFVTELASSMANLDRFWLGVYDSKTPSGWLSKPEVEDLNSLVQRHITGPAESSDKLCLSSDLQVGSGRSWVRSDCGDRLHYMCKKTGPFMKLRTGVSAPYVVPVNLGHGYDVTNSHVLKFSFQGAADLSILLQTQPNSTTAGIFIMICGWRNSKSVIRKRQTNTDTMYTSMLLNLCSVDAFRPFWIGWADATIRVGRGTTEGNNTFMTWRDPSVSDVTVTGVTVSTGRNTVGYWKFPLGEINLAAGKPVTQSSNYLDDAQAHGAQKAVDGCTTGDWSVGCCTHTAQDYEPWLQVDLGRIYPISKVVIYRRTDCYDCKTRMHNFRLFISSVSNSVSLSDKVYQDSRPEPHDIIEVDVPAGRRGRYVRVDVANRDEFLTICELEVYEDLDAATCGPGWLDFNDQCYQLSEDEATWHDAKTRCTAAGGVLGVVTSQAEQLFIYEKGHLFYTSVQGEGYGVWLGIHDTGAEGAWLTVDGEPVPYTDWAQGEPNNSYNEDCASLRLDNVDTGQMNDSPCTRRMRYFCKRKELETTTTTTVTTTTSTTTTPPPTTTTATTATSTTTTTTTIPTTTTTVATTAAATLIPAYGCRAPWVVDRASRTCYLLVQQPGMAWYAAVDECRSRGSKLASITTAGELVVVKDVLVRADIRDPGEWTGVWIGGTDTAVEGTWQWQSDDGPWYPGLQWFDGQPDDTDHIEDCAVMLTRHDRRGLLNDAPCSWTGTLGFLCKTDYEVCDVGWVAGPRGFCYIAVVDTKLDWMSAEMACTGLGAHLASITSTEEQKFMEVLSRDVRGVGVWVGAHDMFVEGTWTWSDGSPWWDGIAWTTGNPDNFGTGSGEDCAMVFPRTLGWIHDGGCHLQLPYICQKSGAAVGDVTPHITSTTVSPVTTTAVPSTIAPITQTPSMSQSAAKPQCPDHWSLGPRAFCYVKMPHSRSWHAAEFACSLDGAHLASITHQDEQTFIQGWVRGVTSASGLWVGAHDAAVEGDWAWTDNSPWWAGIVWRKNMPDNYWGSGGEDCGMVVALREHLGRLNDLTCTTELPYICKKPAVFKDRPTTTPMVPPTPTATETTSQTSTQSSTTTTALASVKCGPSWDDDPNSGLCYQFNLDSMTWRDAESRCVDNGGHLVSITKPEEQYYISGRLHEKASLPSEMWIGANDHDLEGGWAWTDGSPFAYFNWASHEPNNYADDDHVTGEDCGAMVTGDADTASMWDDLPCDFLRGYICKKLDVDAANASVITTTSMPDPSLVEIYQERRPGGVDYTSHDLHELGVTALDNITFNVKAANDAHILLRRSRTDYQGQIVEIVIGGWANQKSVIRSSQQQDPPEAEYLKSGLLAPDEYRSFWISWDRGTVVVGKGSSPGQETIMEWGGLAFNVTYIAVGVGYGSDAHWQFTSGVKYYGCQGIGWVGYGHSCYLIVQEEAEWTDALVSCRKRGGDLAAIADDNEQNFVFSQLPKDYCFNIWGNDSQCEGWAETGECDVNPAWMARHCHRACRYCLHNCRDTHSPRQCTAWARDGECDKNHPWMIYNCAQSCGVCYGAPTRGFWLGMNNRRYNQKYDWSDTSDVTYTNWDTVEPNHYRNEEPSCVAMFLQTGKWNDGPCGEPLPGYICEQPKLLMPVTTQSPFKVGCSMGDSFGYGIYCYMLLSEPKTWKDAEQFCAKTGGNLAVISDRYIQSFISSELVNRLQDHWVGLSSDNGTLSWSDGDTVVFTHFSRAASGGERTSSCFAMTTYRPVGLWQPYTCSTRLPFVCQQLRTGYTRPATTTAPTTALVTCPDGWREFGAFCYKVSSAQSVSRDWPGAGAQCRRYGAELASIHSPEENSAIAGFTMLAGRRNVWIGLHTSEYYTWSDGTAYQYANWAPGEPSMTQPAANCVTFNPDSKQWHSTLCVIAHSYVCKVPKGFVIHTTTTTTPPDVATSQTALCGGKASWLYYQGSCYHVSTGTEATWHDGRKYCMDNGADLASIHSREENGMLLLMLGVTDASVWIGLNDLNLDGAFKWSDGTAAEFFRWQQYEPNDSFGGEKCVVMIAPTGAWNDDNCNRPHLSICRRSNDTSVVPTATPTPPPGGGCPPNFVGFGNNCFFISGHTRQEMVRWETAKANCESMGSTTRLASVHSSMEQAFLITQMAGSDTAFWTGLNDLDDDGLYNWADNSPVNYANWHEYEPSNSGSMYSREQCVEMYGQADKAGYWNNAKCRSYRGYICVTPKSASITTLAPAHSDSGCPAQYQKYGAYCYRLVDQTKAWRDANTTCAQEGGALASIRNPYEQAYIEVLTSGLPTWIGLTVSQYGDSSWSDGAVVTLTRWSVAPSAGDAGCTVQNGSAWVLRTCSDQHPAVCKQTAESHTTTSMLSPPSTTPTTPSLPNVCRDPSWMLYRGNCYYTNMGQPVPFHAALQMCRDRGMELASIHSAEENRALTRMLLTEIDKGDSSGYGAVWIGLVKHPFSNIHDYDQGMAAAWTDDSPYSYTALVDDGATRWSEICVVLSPYNSIWRGTQCIHRHGYVCKAVADMTPESTTTAVTTTTTSTVPTATPPSSVPTSPRPSYRPPHSSPATAYSPALPPFHHPVQAHRTVSDSGSLTGGQIAGIVIGVLGVLFITGVVVYVIRAHRLRTKQYSPGLQSLGFDNALFHKTNEAVALE